MHQTDLSNCWYAAAEKQLKSGGSTSFSDQATLFFQIEIAATAA